MLNAAVDRTAYSGRKITKEHKYDQSSMACQTLHYSIFLYFYRILLHYYCIFWDLYLISGHFYSICFVSILYSTICIQYIRLFLLYKFRLYCISFGFVFNIWSFLFDLTSLLVYIFWICI